VALFVMGAAQVLCMVSCNTAIQVNVDEGFRGRISSLFTMSFFAAAPGPRCPVAQRPFDTIHSSEVWPAWFGLRTRGVRPGNA
jgi:hypothetical protein